MSAKLEIVYGPDFDMVIEKNMVYVDNEFIVSSKPIKFLEDSIAACIGLNILKYINTENIKNPFGNITINISGETINIRVNVDNSLIDKFVEICKNCYITNHLTFKVIIFNIDTKIKI